MSYTLNLYNTICQLHLNKTGKSKQIKLPKGPGSKYPLEEPGHFQAGNQGQKSGLEGAEALKADPAWNPGLASSPVRVLGQVPPLL